MVVPWKLPVEERQRLIDARPRCQLCGGNAGRLVDGAHVFCAIVGSTGERTPSLGDVCLDCLGVGNKPQSAVGPVNPNQAAMDAWAPQCARCNGSGLEPGTKQVTL